MWKSYPKDGFALLFSVIFTPMPFVLVAVPEKVAMQLANVIFIDRNAHRNNYRIRPE